MDNLDKTAPHESIRSRTYFSVTAAAALTGIFMTPLARLLRPLPPDAVPLMVFIVGVLPNFGAGLALPFFLYVSIQQQILRKKEIRLIPNIYIAGLVTCIGLVLWELLQYFCWAYPIDVYDLIATAAGVIAALVIHQVVARKQRLI